MRWTLGVSWHFAALLVVTGCLGGNDSPPQVRAISGVVRELSGSGLVLQRNGANDLAVEPNATGFQFPGWFAEGAHYVITVGKQPTNPAQTCAIENGEGRVGPADVVNVGVVCALNMYSVTTTVTGLVGTGLTLELDDDNRVVVATSGTVTFP